jgi:4-hydroxybenzoyl-CoA reductase subunit beta
MLLPAHQFSKPASLAEALTVLARGPGQVRLLAGGTDVIFNMRGRLFEPDILLSVRDLSELQEVTQQVDGAVVLGAGCRLTDLETHPLVARYPGLVAGFRAVASRHVRNMATLGGNLNLDTRCWYTNQTAEWRKAKGPCLKTGVDACHAIKSAPVCVALNASDTAPALLALDASIVLASVRGERTVRLADFYTDDGIAHTVRQADEIMLRVILPPPAGRMVYLKETARKGNDFAYATIAIWADGHADQCSQMRIALGSVTTRPLLLEGIARQLVASGINDVSIEVVAGQVREALGVLTNLYTPAAYKGRIARSLLQNALQQLRTVQANAGSGL